MQTATPPSIDTKQIVRDTIEYFCAPSTLAAILDPETVTPEDITAYCDAAQQAVRRHPDTIRKAEHYADHGMGINEPPMFGEAGRERAISRMTLAIMSDARDFAYLSIPREVRDAADRRRPYRNRTA